MPDFKNPAVLGFYIENMKKEKTLRLRWFFRNLEKIQSCAVTPPGQKITEDATILLRLKQEAQSISNFRFLRKRPIPEPKEERKEITLTMKSVEPEIKNILFSNVSKNVTERYLYERRKKAPEDKYNNITCTSWSYGWELKKNVQKPLPKDYARCDVFKRTIYRKSGLGADPTHYREPN